jgi:hypothetical protein
MSQAWSTKYGTRRVRQDPPTLDEAIFAAKGLTDSLQGQSEIAAALMGLPVQEVRTRIMKSGRSTGQTEIFSTGRGLQRAVVVERQSLRRPLRERLIGSRST